MKYLFGPVNSRRFGRSLGIDLLPSKICTMNCVYCECGETKICTDEVKEYVPTNEVIRELTEYLAKKPLIDAITFAGSGEPTLHSGIGTIINFLKENFPHYRVVVLTNGSLFWRDDVRKNVLSADVIVPSLDAVTEEVFQEINRPCGKISSERIIEGLVELRDEFNKLIFLEVFIVPTINDNFEEIDRIRQAALRIKPDCIQLNTLHRPPAVEGIQSADRSFLEKVKDLFFPLKVEIVTNASLSYSCNGSLNVEEVLTLIKRRPSTKEDIIKSLGLSREDVEKVIEDLLRKGVIIKKENKEEFYAFNR